MKHSHIVWLGLVAIFASSCSTTTTKNDQLTISKAFTEAFAPVFDISILQSGAIDIVYCSASFRGKNDRWPKDYDELSAFVKQSDGYLMLGEHDRVDLKPLPNDSLEIGYIRPGQTNEMKITLSSSDDKK